MKATVLDENTAASRLKPDRLDTGFYGSAVFGRLPKGFLFFSYDACQQATFIIKGLMDTTFYTENFRLKVEKEEDAHEPEYYTDDYDLVANVPFKESFKVKVKIKSISRLKPKVFVEPDELDQIF